MTWSRRASPQPIVCGHRGTPAHEPENTLASFAAAAALGATWIEFDVRPAKDGELAIHHDPQTSSGVHIASTNFAELDPSIPRFGDLVAAQPALGLDIELKTDGIDMSIESFADIVLDQIDSHCASTLNLIVTSFDAAILELVRELRPHIATGLVFRKTRPADAIKIAIDAGHVALAPWVHLLTPELVDNVRSAGLDIITWTVNQPQQVRLAVELGVDMIIGDDPTVIIDNL